MVEKEIGKVKEENPSVSENIVPVHREAKRILFDGIVRLAKIRVGVSGLEVMNFIIHYNKKGEVIQDVMDMQMVKLIKVTVEVYFEIIIN